MNYLWTFDMRTSTTPAFMNTLLHASPRAGHIRDSWLSAEWGSKAGLCAGGLCGAAGNYNEDTALTELLSCYPSAETQSSWVQNHHWAHSKDCTDLVIFGIRTVTFPRKILLLPKPVSILFRHEPGKTDLRTFIWAAMIFESEKCFRSVRI